MTRSRTSILAGTAGMLCLAGGLTAAFLGSSAAPAAGQAVARSATTTISVTAGKPSEYRFTLSKTTVTAGTVVFKVVNRGKKPHTFSIAKLKTKVIAPGKTATLKVVFTKAGHIGYLSTVKGDAGAGMKGVLVVKPPTIVAPGPPTTVTTTTTPATTCANPASTTVTVSLFEYGITLSQTTVPCGTVTFNVTNTGAINHSFDLTGVAASPTIAPGANATVTASVTKPGAIRFQCDVTGHAGLGMTGNLTVT